MQLHCPDFLLQEIVPSDLQVHSIFKNKTYLLNSVALKYLLYVLTTAMKMIILCFKSNCIADFVLLTILFFNNTKKLYEDNNYHCIVEIQICHFHIGRICFQWSQAYKNIYQHCYICYPQIHGHYTCNLKIFTIEECM